MNNYILKNKVNILEMKCLRSLVGLSLLDSWNEQACWRAGIEGELASREDQRVF